MSNNYYALSGAPSTNSPLSSSTMRAEFALIQAAFDLLPTLAGNGLKAVRVNSGGTQLEAVAVTGTGSAVFSTAPTIGTATMNSPTLVTPAFSGAISTAVGIGVSPTFKLDVKGGAGNGVPAARFEVDGGSGIMFEVERQASGAGTAILGTQTNHNLGFKTNDTEQVFITADGRLYGVALHNNAGSMTGTATQYIASGTDTVYTGAAPTAVSNCSALSVNKALYTRLGNIVSVDLSVNLTVTAGGQATFNVTLPIPSAVQSNSENVMGLALEVNNFIAGHVTAISANTAQATWIATASGIRTVQMMFRYVVL